MPFAERGEEAEGSPRGRGSAGAMRGAGTWHRALAYGSAGTEVLHRAPDLAMTSWNVVGVWELLGRCYGKMRGEVGQG